MDIEFHYDLEKDAWLKRERGIGFEQIITLLEDDTKYEIAPHPNPGRYPNQKCLVVIIEDYVWSVPIVIDGHKVTMKTAFPNRKWMKQWKKEGKL